MVYRIRTKTYSFEVNQSGYSDLMKAWKTALQNFDNKEATYEDVEIAYNAYIVELKKAIDKIKKGVQII